MKPAINLKPLQHRGQEQIGVYFKNDSGLNILIRSKAGGTWSQTNRCWYIPMSRAAIDKLKAAIKEDATLETTELKKYLEEKKKSTAPSTALIKKTIFPVVKSLQSNPLKPFAGISPVNKHVLPAMEQLLKLKAFSPSTIRT
jgi:hypothetical protein